MMVALLSPGIRTVKHTNENHDHVKHHHKGATMGIGDELGKSTFPVSRSAKTAIVWRRMLTTLSHSLRVERITRRTFDLCARRATRDARWGSGSGIR